MKIPIEAQNLYKKARIYQKEKDYTNSLLYLNRSLELEPNYAEAIGILSYVHIQLNFKDMAKEEVFKLAEKSIKLNPNSPLLWNCMGFAYKDIRNDLEEAIKC